MVADSKSLDKMLARARGSWRPGKLIRLLKENAPIYKDKSAAEVNRIKGFILAGCEKTGCTEAVLPFMLEELENAKHPYLIGGAAKGLRGQKIPATAAISYLLKAMENLSHGDDSFSFDSPDLNAAGGRLTSATQEIIHTLAWYGAYAKPLLPQIKELFGSVRINLSADNKKLFQQAIADIERDDRKTSDDCCSVDAAGAINASWYERLPGRSKQIRSTVMEDHTGTSISYDNYFFGKPGIVVFFYTRCDNPNKCSLTITRLAQLQKLICDRGWEDKVKIAAFTYDPDFDNPGRLRHYCESRQLILGHNCSSFRIKEDFGSFQRYFRLGVNYLGSVVNKHTVELYIIDKNGTVCGAATRLKWDHEKVLAKLAPHLPGSKNLQPVLHHFMNNVLSVLLFAGFSIFPKCPLCWAAYLSILGINSVHVIALYPWLVPVFIGFFILNLVIIWRSCIKKNSFIPFYISLTGAFFVATGGYLLHWKTGSFIGLALLLIASMSVSLPLRTYQNMLALIANAVRGTRSGTQPLSQ